MTQSTIKTWLPIAALGAALWASTAIAAKGVVSAQKHRASTLSEAAAADAVVLNMAVAFKKNDSKALTQLLPQSQGSQLAPWAAYWEIKARLGTVTQADIDRFAKRYANTYVSDRLRADWLILLGQRRDWSGFAANLPAYRMGDDKDIRCYALHVAFLKTGVADAPAVEQLWMSQKDTSAGGSTGCAYAAEALESAGLMSPVVAWRKAYKGQTPPQAAWDKLSSEQKNWAWGFAGKSLAQKLDLEALAAFGNVSRAQDLSPDMLDWWARAALRRKDWPQVARVIDAMAPQGQKEWVLWRDRASVDKAVDKVMVPEPKRSSQLAIGAVPPLALPGLTRALYAIQNGLRPEGVREWNFEVNLARGAMNDADRLAAADMACAAQVWDRCINTSERTQSLIHWEQRYPMPYKEAIVSAAQANNLDPAFVFGLIRQESRFVADIQSSVGAAGLMQLMPATARWTAKRMGLAGFSTDQVQDVTTNVRLGAAYLKYVLDEFDGNPALAAAAYNAGPQRVRQWRSAMAADTGVITPLDIAIWSENIPFAETRDYVKKVLANTDVYRRMDK